MLAQVVAELRGEKEEIGRGEEKLRVTFYRPMLVVNQFPTLNRRLIRWFGLLVSQGEPKRRPITSVGGGF